MTRAAFRQADIERILRAAKATGSIVKIDIRTLECTIYPMPADEPQRDSSPSPGEPGWAEFRAKQIARENWDDE